MAEIQIRNMLILENDLLKKVKVDNENFTIKAILPKTRKEIARTVAFQYNGYPAASFSVDDRNRIERDATIDHVVDESPDWWVDSGECPQDSVLEDLYIDIIKWDNEFQTKLKKNKFSKRSTKG